MRKRPIIIGITGGLGTGKSTIAAIFKRLGASVIDADTIAHQALENGTAVYRRVIEEFGISITDKAGDIDRAKLGEKVFQNKMPLEKLCRIIHPTVIEKIEKSIRDISKRGSVPAIAIDAPLLVEAGLHNRVDFLIVVRASLETQIGRAAKKTGLSRGAIMMRIKNQVPLSAKLKIADYIVDNEGENKDLELDVKKIWEEIKSGRKQ